MTTRLFNGSDLVRPTGSTDGGQTWHDARERPDGQWRGFYLLRQPDQPQPARHHRLHATCIFPATAARPGPLKYTAADSGAGIVVGGAFWDGSNIYLGTNDGILVSTNGGTTFALANIGGVPAGQVILSFAGAKSRDDHPLPRGDGQLGGRLRRRRRATTTAAAKTSLTPRLGPVELDRPRPRRLAPRGPSSPAWP